jgi:hypothetical protein
MPIHLAAARHLDEFQNCERRDGNRSVKRPSLVLRVVDCALMIGRNALGDYKKPILWPAF